MSAGIVKYRCGDLRLRVVAAVHYDKWIRCLGWSIGTFNRCTTHTLEQGKLWLSQKLYRHQNNTHSSRRLHWSEIATGNKIKVTIPYP
jgi:hypothetical protein